MFQYSARLDLTLINNKLQAFNVPYLWSHLRIILLKKKKNNFSI